MLKSVYIKENKSKKNKSSVQMQETKVFFYLISAHFIVFFGCNGLPPLKRLPYCNVSEIPQLFMCELIASCWKLWDGYGHAK